MSDRALKIVFFMLILAIIGGLVEAVREQLAYRQQERARCDHWLQGATPSESVRVYTLRPACLQ